ncbi:MAG: DNA replication and repair protein RecF [Oscillospiraceae bacterium]|jgi:DNA replication and repair protein RecF|nr:DNA replication and repair protein RecF [Oscillospiraceae bacterium]
MIIKRIQVENFRNIKHAELEFCEGVNIFYGDNAQGKTNMLEAISLCLGKGFRRARTASLVPFHGEIETAPDTSLTLFYEYETTPGKENIINYRIINGRASVDINGISLKSAADLYGELKHVVFAPEHLFLVKGAAELRRIYIDNIALMQHKAHKRAIADYTAALKQLAALNSEIIASPDTVRNTRDMIGIWSDILIRQGINLTYGRLKYFELLRNTAINLYDELTVGREELGVMYRSNVFGDIQDRLPDFNDKDGLYKAYVDMLNKYQIYGQRDFRVRVGAHRDDLAFFINGVNAREFGSQGQIKSISLILKLAEAEIIRNHNRETPVILLDEVLGELDGKRRDYVINKLNRSQVFITSCDYQDYENSEDLRAIHVKRGSFSASGGGRFNLL